MTREDAEKELRKRTIKSLGFCPLLRAECRVDCVCYRPPRIFSRNGTHFAIFDGWCVSPMIYDQAE